MGFATIIVINNDMLNRLEDPDFGKILLNAIRGYSFDGKGEVPGLVGCATILAQDHRDVAPVVTSSGGGHMLLGYGSWKDTEHEILKRLAEQHGFRLVSSKELGPAPSVREKCTDCKERGNSLRKRRKA